MKKQILCVDDDAEVLKSLVILFEDDFEVLTTTSAHGALEILKKTPGIRLIISDQRMPGMSGLQMFQELKKSLPEMNTYNIIYSGYSEVEGEMTEMIMAKVINEFLTKSCPASVLIERVSVAFEKMNETKKIPGNELMNK